MVGPSRHFLSLALAVALGAAVAGCKQGPGDRCEVNRDCEDGYYCDPSSGDNSGGICKPNPTEADAGTVVDAGQPAADAAADAADLAAEDAPEERAANVDAVTDAASPPDSAAETPPEDGAGEESGG